MIHYATFTPETNPRGMSPLSLSVLAHLQQHDEASRALLFERYSHQLISEPRGESNTAIIASAHNKFRRRLEYLVSAGHVVHRTEGDAHYYRLGSGVPLPKAAPKPRPVIEATSLGQGERTTAPAYDLMHAPVYVPERPAFMRPGAADHQRYASRGQRC